MKKRLRKKRCLGEFKRIGYTIEGKLKEGANLDKFMDDLIQLVESRSMTCGGGFGPDKIWFTLEGDAGCKIGHGSNMRHGSKYVVTQEDAEFVKTWLQNRNDVESIVIGEPHDTHKEWECLNCRKIIKIIKPEYEEFCNKECQDEFREKNKKAGEKTS